MRIDELDGNRKRGRGRVGLALALLLVACASIGFSCLNPRPEELPSASLEGGSPGEDAARSAPVPAAAGVADNSPQDAPVQILLVPAPPKPPPFPPLADAGVSDAAVPDAGTD